MLQSYYALVVRGNLQRGESVYINAGIMGVCLAALNIALGIGAKVFVGFNNQVERKYLRDTFPEVILVNELEFFSNTIERLGSRSG